METTTITAEHTLNMKLRLLISSALLCGYISSHAQKLPNKQEESVWAPSTINVDGKPTEWNGQFKAYNNATSISYTLSNDDRFLYLSVEATDPDNINKIYSTGLVFQVKANKKKDKDMVTLTYPVFDPGKENQFNANIKVKPTIDPTSAQSIAQADSFMTVINKQMTGRAKWIRVSGIKSVDTLISVYNEQDIKAASLFNNAMVYTLEMALPLKYIDVKPNDPVVLDYHIQLNPIRRGGWNNMQTEKVVRNGLEMTHVLGTVTPATMAVLQNLNSVTDFRGDYVLATKGK